MKRSALKIIICTLSLAAGFSPAAQMVALDSIVPYEDYAQWPAEQQIAYELEARQAFFDFESGSQAKMEFAGSATLQFWATLFPAAFAAPEKACLVGGVRRAMVNLSDRYVCPTSGRPCGPQGDKGFLCGTVYNDACISREPVGTISKRCLEAAGNTPSDEARYSEKRSAFQSVAADCRSGTIGAQYKSQCDNFLQRMNRLNVNPAAVVQSAPATKESATAPAVARSAPMPPARPRAAATAPSQPPPAASRRETPTASGDCLSRNRAKLGVLACVACGMENAAPAEIRNHGGGVSKWVALLGVMAQSSYGPYNVNDEVSRKAFQQRVAEMVSSYGYCTDREYPVTPGNATRELIDGRPIRGNQALQFAQNFELMSTINGIFSRTPENQHAPLMYAQRMFDDSSRSTGWDTGNVQNRQWRFRSMLKAHRYSYPNSAFSKCGNAVENRLRTSSHFNMCPIREGRWPNGQRRIEYQSHVTAKEMANNQNFYEAMASSCGLPKQRPMPSRLCDNNCWGNFGTFRHASSHMPQCDSGGAETYSQAMERGKVTPPPTGKPGEPSVGRGIYGGDHGGADGGNSGGNGGDSGSPGGSSGAGDGGKGGESGGSR